MNTPIPRWARRVAAVLLLLAAEGLVYVAVIAPVVASYDDTRQRLGEQKELLSRYLAVAGGRESLEKRVQALRERQSNSGAFLYGKTEALAAAALQDRVRSVMRKAGGDVRSVQNLPAESADGLTRVGLRVQVVANIRDVRTILHELETGDPLLFVEELDLRGRLQRGEDDKPTVSEELLVRLSVVGYRLGELS
ncbi:type II secretion system protein GspM [Ferruginivarius sediminum]|uniref:General secretion pathway protein GspM n=1 Tax=Ferruginivarius sediminum TaxID=2661937 RepID=A0A369TJI9_9PROT|nr:type II secretion system protein GspM [Ferruginivarius sediminum]RDD63066.1 hypothetical protein DRB17_04650 [Ferruginivarius sediminum]